MGNIIELRDSTNTKSYPLTKAQAVYFDDGSTIDYILNAISYSKIEDVPLINGKYLNSQGQAISSDNITSSDFIKVFLGSVINYKLSGSAGWSLLATYNSSKTFVSRVVNGDGWTNYKEGSYTIPEGVSYVRFCYVTADLRNSYFSLLLNPVVSYSKIEDAPLISGKYLNYQGQAISNDSITSSDFIKVFPGSVINYRLSGSDGWSLLATYNSSKTFVSRVVNGNGWTNYQEGSYTIPEGVSYVRFCYVTANLTNSYFSLSLNRTNRVGYIENKITAISNPLGILDFHPDSEILPIVNNLKHRLVNSSFEYLDTQLVLCDFTDIHGDGTNLKRIIEFCNRYSSYIDTVIHTGDSLYDRWSDGYDFWANTSGSEKILNCIGNHDVKFVDADGNPISVTQQDVYNRFFAPYIGNWGVVQPDNAAANGLLYYYKDYTTPKIRLIVLNCMNYTTAQNDWLTTVLADAKTNDYAVIIAEHYPIALTQFDGCAFTALDTVGAGSASTLLSAQQAVNTFITGGGEFIMWLCGHTHKDFTGKITAYPNQFMFVSDLASMNHIKWGDTARINGTKSQDLFNLIGIDRTTKTVRIYRIGAEYDRYLKHKVSMIIDYENARLVWSS